MDTGAQDAALGATRDELAAYLRHHEAREKALVAALEYYAQDEMIPIPGEEAGWVYRNWYNAVARDALAARAASLAPDGVAGEERNA